MKRFRWLIVVPLLWGGVFLVLALFLRGSGAYEVFMRTELELATSVALLGGLAAAFAFDRGEYLRRAWLFVAAAIALAWSTAYLSPLGFEAMGETPLLVLRAVLVSASNLSLIVGVYMLARTWRVAGLTLPGPTLGKVAVVAATILLAFGLAGPGIVTFGGRLLGGDLTAAAGAASAFGDMVTLILIGPLLLTALALRGGLFVWPWALLTTSCVAWLFYDSFYTIGPMLGLSQEAARIGYETCRALGCTFGGAAGLAQRFIAVGR
jgi:hypothetical protein